MKKTLKERLIAPFVEPYARYQYADALHAIRLGVAIVLALIVNHVSQLAHGEWTTITVFVILGLLQYQGAIYTKAKERVLGTLFGIGVGLVLLWMSQAFVGIQWVHYLLVGVVSGVIGYYAVKQLGYIGLLTGITMCMIISSTSNLSIDGLFRALNVLVGTFIAVLVTLVLPLKSTLMWRFLIANNLEACADVYDGVADHIQSLDTPQPADTSQADDDIADNIATVTAQHTLPNYDNTASKPSKKSKRSDKTRSNYQEGSYDHYENYKTHKDLDEGYIDTHSDASRQTRLDLGMTTVTSVGELSDTDLGKLIDEDMVARFKKINKRLLTVRTHIAATANETGIDTQTLDQIQRTHRTIIGTIDLLLSAAPKLANSPIDEDNLILLKHYHHELTQAMRHMAAVLKSPSDEMFRPITRIQVSDYPSIHHLSFEWQGYFWLTQTLQSQLQSMSDILKLSKPKWYKASGLRYQRQEQRRIVTRGHDSDVDI